MAPVVETAITQQTIWQALTGETPPLALPARPISPAVLDSRRMELGGLFVALKGPNEDGHAFIHQALENGAGAIICEERGLAQLSRHDSLVIRCTRNNRDLPNLDHSRRDPSLATRPFVYVVDNSLKALQNLGAFQRIHRSHPHIRAIGITGSVGKTSTKELSAAVLSQRFRTHRNRGNLNSEEGLPLTLLGLDFRHERAVLEMGMYSLGEIRQLCNLAQPHVGVVTNVGPVHVERLGSIERIAQAKAELIQALPGAAQGGTAILNWDDERVKAMSTMTDARIFRYGLTPEADLWADEIESAGMEGIRFRFHHRQDGGKINRLYVKVPLLGRHSVHTALRAAAVGLVEGMTWQEIAVGLQRTTGQLRLVTAAGINHSTIIDDTYNASPTSTLAALNLLDDLRNGQHKRCIAVLGDMLELGDYTDEGHRSVGIRAAAVADVLVTVGELGRTIAEEAQAVGYNPDQLHVTSSADGAIDVLRQIIQANDLILVKGSRSVGMDRIVTEISLDSLNTNNHTARKHALAE